MRLSNLLAEELVLADMPAATKDEAIATLLGVIGKRYPLLDRTAIAAAIDERERIENTSYGHGFAFPHARTDAVERMYIAVGVSKRGLNDRTPDGEPLQTVCLMLTPSNISQLYLQTLSAFARFARDQRNLKMLLEAKTPLEVINAVYQSNVTVDRDLLVRDIMVEKVIAARPLQTLKEIANLFYRHRIGAMPVVNDESEVIGQIEHRDLIRAALPDYASLAARQARTSELPPLDDLLKANDRKRVEEIMQTDPCVTNEDTPVVELAALMIFKNLRMAPVVRERKLVGVVVVSDIVSKIIRG